MILYDYEPTNKKEQKILKSFGNLEKICKNSISVVFAAAAIAGAICYFVKSGDSTTTIYMIENGTKGILNMLLRGI